MMKYDLSRMSWAEAQEAFKERPIAILPVGTTEQNGPHIPLGNDAIVAEYVAREVAKQAKLIYAPLIPYGCSRPFRNFPGTLWLRPETLEAVVYDVGSALARHGCKGLIVANNHGPNHYPVEQALRRIMDETSMKTISFWPGLAIKELAGDIFKSKPGLPGHGGEPMTSVIMALAGDDVARQHILDASYTPNPMGRIKVKDSNASLFEGCTVNLYLDMKDVTPTGQTGDARYGDPKVGMELVNKAVAWAVDLAGEFLREVVRL